MQLLGKCVAHPASNVLDSVLPVQALCSALPDTFHETVLCSSSKNTTPWFSLKFVERERLCVAHSFFRDLLETLCGDMWKKGVTFIVPVEN